MNSSTPPTENEKSEPLAPSEGTSFADEAEQEQIGIVREFLEFLVENKAWWMVPILLALVLIGVAAWFAGSPLAPFIYPLF